ncbi:MAG: S-adenosylmethionine:tRNA ribosyltransferase-isomerase [Bdellovibrio sp.]|nr:S-adenosylmethionine:tRNA ribosyltransferase-isomerase [Bdellovibrio sp.]
MKLTDLKYEYPEELIATEPSRPARVMWVEKESMPIELTIEDVLGRIPPGDVLVINNTKVLKRRVFTKNEIEVLFLDQVGKSEHSNQWKVLFPSKKLPVGSILELPHSFKMKLIEKGRPQIVEVTPAIQEADFEKFAELPLPPYIQKARSERHNVSEDASWYQTAWAARPGSMAAPTASLHFTMADLKKLESRGVIVVEITLHVGLGTFLPVTAEDLDQHQMHAETYDVSEKVWQAITSAKENKKHIWTLGTTSTRVVEAIARTGKLSGSTDILLQVGSDFKIVDRLMTNFHQPESTLLALVAGFVGLNRVKECYIWAIARKFKLFSYGDFSVWLK